MQQPNTSARIYIFQSLKSSDGAILDIRVKRIIFFYLFQFFLNSFDEASRRHDELARSFLFGKSIFRHDGFPAEKIVKFDHFDGKIKNLFDVN